MKPVVGIAISILLVLAVAGCKDKSADSALGGSPSLSALSITPANPVIPSGSSQNFTATGTYSDATTRVITTSVTWSSSNPAVATVSGEGLAQSVAAGTAVITASLGNVSGTTTVTVRDISAGSPFGFHPASVTKSGLQQQRVRGCAKYRGQMDARWGICVLVSGPAPPFRPNVHFYSI